MVFVNILNTICVFFDVIIYNLATFSYVLFSAMCEMNASSIGESMEALVSRVQVFAGVIMLFVVAFQLLKTLVNPDTLGSATSDIAKKIAVTVVLLISMNFIFDQLAGFQTAILQSNAVQNIILGTEAPSDNSIQATGYEKYVQTGKYFSHTLFFAFVDIDVITNLKSEIMGSAETNPTKTLWDVIPEINEEGVYYRFPLISGACGILLMVIFVAFALDVGVRAFTILLLQVIAPIPIIMYITPKGNEMLSKFFKTYVSTYIQLFGKIALAYIMMFLMQTTMKAILVEPADAASSLFPNLGETGDFFRATLYIVVVIALFFFARKFPKMIGDVLGLELGGSVFDPFKATGNILKGGAHLGMGAVGGAAGAAIGAAATIGTGAGFGGALRAAARGAATGATGAYRVNNARQALTNMWSSTRDNVRSQRQLGYQIGDQGGQRGIRAQNRNAQNERTIADANRKLEVINKGEELRKKMINDSEEEFIRVNGADSRESYIQNALNNDSAYRNAQASLEHAKRTGNSNSIASAMRNVQSARASAEANANLAIKSGGKAGLDADIAAGEHGVVNQRYIDYKNYQNHISSSTDVYQDSAGNPLTINPSNLNNVHDNLDGANGIRTRENQRIINANSNPTARAAAQARVRGAANAATHAPNNTNSGGH